MPSTLLCALAYFTVRSHGSGHGLEEVGQLEQKPVNIKVFYGVR